MELTEFLRARLDEDEVVAKALAGATIFVDGKPDFYGVGGPAADAFWEHFTPARVLREVEAKRAIVAAYERAVANSEPHDHFEDGLGLALEEIASVWSDHPDYRPERDWGA